MRGGSGVPVYLFPQLTAFYPTHSVSGRIMEHGISPFLSSFYFFCRYVYIPGLGERTTERARNLDLRWGTE